MGIVVNLEGKVALVTGASSGLGAGFAKALAKAGAQVVIASRRVEMLERLRAEVEACGGFAHAVSLNVADLSSVRSAIEHAEAKVGPIDILVNNAGVANKGCELHELSPEDYDCVMDMNVRGAFFVAQEVAKRMIGRTRSVSGRHCRIINIGSIAGLAAFAGRGFYGLSKAAVIHMTKAMAAEWGEYGISVNAVCPGFIRTEMTAEFLASDEGKQLVARLPRRRVGEVTDLEGVLLLLASDESHFMNGAVIKVDDGLLT